MRQCVTRLPQSLEIMLTTLSYPSIEGSEATLEATMAHELRKSASGRENHRRFPPEAEGDFDIVSEREVAEWREKLNERYGIGKGRLKVVEEPA